MKRFLVQRAVLAVPTLFGVTVAAFVLAHLAPGDASALLLPPQASESDRVVFRQAYGLDKPLPVQYLLFLSRLSQGDLGRSIANGQPVTELLWERLPATAQLATSALAISVVAGVTVGVTAALKRRSPFDHVVTAFVAVGQSTATFWLGMMLILVVAVTFRLLPVSGSGDLRHLVLPSLTLAAFFTAMLVRLVRSSMLDVLDQDFIRTARGKGLSSYSVAVRHGLRAALIPLITVVGLQFGALMTGAVVTERIFAWPGVGSLVVDAIFLRDYPVVQGVVLMLAFMYVVLNLVVDLLYAMVDPRIRYS